MLDVAHVGSVDDRLAQGIPQKTLVLDSATPCAQGSPRQNKPLPHL